MKGLIINKYDYRKYIEEDNIRRDSEEYNKFAFFGEVKQFFREFGGEEKNYNWLISNYICTSYPSKYIEQGKRYVWTNGDELLNILENKKRIQFIWGIFSGFKKEIRKEDVIKNELPFVAEKQHREDGGPKSVVYKINSVLGDKKRIQHPLADVEFTIFNPSFIILKSTNDKMIESFRENNPIATEDFSELERYV